MTLKLQNPILEELSHNMKVIYLGVEIRKTENPWGNITGKIKLGKKINIEELLKHRGFEHAQRDTGF